MDWPTSAAVWSASGEKKHNSGQLHSHVSRQDAHPAELSRPSCPRSVIQKRLAYPLSSFLDPLLCHSIPKLLAMASRTVPRALRLSARVAAPRRTFVTAVRARPSAATATAARSPVVVPTRGVKTIDFAGTPEVVYGLYLIHRTNCKEYTG